MQQRLYLFAFLFLAGCKKPDFASRERASSTLQNVGDYINNNFDLSLFAYAVKKTGFLDSLNNAGGTFTVFAPTNEAFNADSILSTEDLDKFSVDSLRYIVRTHILPQKLFFSDVPDNLDNLYPNLNGVNLYISAFSDPTYGTDFVVDGVGASKQTTGTTQTFDIAQANGVVHLMPALVKVASGSVQDFLNSRPDLSDFVAAMKHFGFWDSLAQNPVTVFPVNNAGMEQWGLTADSIARMDTSQYFQILFSGYFQYPHHLFLSDLGLIGGIDNSSGTYTYDDNAYFPAANGDIVALGASYTGTGVYIKSAAGKYLGPEYSPYGYPVFDAFVPSLENIACTNGVVDVLTDVLILPDAAHK